MPSIKSISRWKAFFMVNRDIFLRTLCLVLVSSFFLIASTKMEDPILAVNSLLLQFFTLFSYLMDGFAYSGEALVGKYIGQKNAPALRKCIRLLFRWGIGLSLLFTLLYALFGQNLLRILTNDSIVLDTSMDYLVWVLLIPLSGFSAFLWDGIYMGATASKPVRNCMFIAVFFFFGIWFLSSGMGNNGLWLAFIIYLLIRGFCLWFFAKKHIYGRVEV